MQLRVAETLSCLGRAAEATAFRRGAVTSDPDDHQMLSHLLFHLHFASGITPGLLLDEHKAFGKRFPLQKYTHPNPPIPDKVLNVGYVSGDFHQHPIGLIMAAVLSGHSRSVNAFCYYNSTEEDKVTELCKQNAYQWRNIVGMKEADIEDLFLTDGIDILVDLSGHSGKNILTIFAKKPAPVQVTWAGYFGTTGLNQIDYILADESLVPYGAEHFYTEKIVRLPESYVCFAVPSHAPPVNELPALTNGYITFGCFNKVHKINPQVIGLWGKILRTLPTAKLMIKTQAISDEAIQNRIPSLFAAEGIEADRLILDGKHSPHPDYLAAYSQVDITLDPVPFSGGATTFDSLYMGVPVVTFPGDTWASRHSLSYINAVGGLDEWIADSEDEYVNIAYAAAHNLEWLVDQRRHLRDQVLQSSLCQSKIFTVGLEKAYRDMWKTWCLTEANAA